MSKMISFKGTVPIGEQDRIKLSTLDGKTGYQIKKFQIISTTPGDSTSELVAQIFDADQTGSVTGVVNFSDGNLLAIAYLQDSASSSVPASEVIIFDNRTINQDIFVTVADVSGNTVPGNYYIELEKMSISDTEATMLTLQSIRTITE